MACSVHVKEAIVITPSEPTPSRVLSLSALDSQLFLRFTIEYLLVYRSADADHSRLGLVDRSTTTNQIKTALAKALVPYYPLAGRVRAKPDVSSSSCLEVVCRGQGAVFIEAVSDHYTIKDLVEKPPKSVTQWRKLLSFHVADVLQGAPPLVVQLTWLNDGGATLGVGINHTVCDGVGSAEFLNTFAMLCIKQHEIGDNIKPKPIWDRHILNNNNQIIKQYHHPEFNKIADVSAFLSRFANEKLVPTSITFHKKRLNDLKKVARSDFFTSFEVLSAHVWRSWAKSLSLPSNQTLKLLFSVNVRDRVKPSVPGGYYGNAFVLGCAQTTVKDLTENGLRYATMLIKRAKERVDNEYVKSVIDSVSESRASPDSVGVLILSEWSKLGLERVDFGMGKPVHVGSICCDRYCLFLPVFDHTDAIKVMVALPASAVDKYEHLARRTTGL